MVINNRAQLFLLAAVIISAIVLSLGITANQARVNREPGSFEDISYEVKKETGAVVDYDIYTYTDISVGNLEDFVEKIATDIIDRNADAEFTFIYGDNTRMTVKNYGSEDVTVGDENVQGASERIGVNLCYSQTSCVSTDTLSVDYDSSSGEYVLDEEHLADKERIDLTIGGGSVSFPVSRHRQVIFVIQQEVDGENFVAIG